MTLREFVADTLMDIMRGVRDGRLNDDKIAPTVVMNDANLEVRRASNGRAFLVDFDVAVIVSKTTDVSGKGAVRVHVVEAGIDGSTSTEHTTVSRIRFRVPVCYDDDSDVA